MVKNIIEENGQLVEKRVPKKDSNGDIIYNDTFTKSIMLQKEQTSLMAVQWLMYKQALLNRDVKKFTNESIKIEHAYYRGEKEFCGWKPDGFLDYFGDKYFYEFLGCHVHPDCPYCDNNDKLLCKNPEVARQTWNKKKSIFEENGTLEVVRSCQWETKLKEINIDLAFLCLDDEDTDEEGEETGNTENKIEPPPKTDLPRILYKNETVDVLLKSIQNEEVFGFAICDISTPESLRKNYGPSSPGTKPYDFFFPPLFRHEEIDETMVSGYMKQRVMEDERKLGNETVLQCYNGKQMLVFTPLLKFYMDIGLEVTNVTKFIQYQPECFCKPFMSRVTKMRIEATMDNCESKQLTAKVS